MKSLLDPAPRDQQKTNIDMLCQTTLCSASTANNVAAEADFRCAHALSRAVLRQRETEVADRGARLWRRRGPSL